ncbi:hypothetical protein Q3A66_08505 [Hymenobacter sp. BT770]|uniref:hypothetical protein n=1 Tax=Hymenobacter sp. BT770 TaxID=2886942 RepID=UPI001D121C16|nr:hypothetical protein [Hymenobacter sp. BT770]MCC3152979.1 hypothetical protein [Hymenobacter sp. BT770]MDO3415107.1 hypothetical protein [Hymenobacter sp. BT770]
MPKLIDYPRTTYAGAWELAEVTDDTGGKCAIETAARKLNRKVSGSFKAIIGSAVKFGLLTSKRDLLTTTTLFKRIKHAYDKQEELLFHREAFLTPPLFTQLCRKFRSRELPIQMLDVMLIREFGVEEINAQGVAKAFVEGCRMVGLLDERNMIADIDALAAQQAPRRELASPQPIVNSFRGEHSNQNDSYPSQQPETAESNHAHSEPFFDDEFESVKPLVDIMPTARPVVTPTQKSGGQDAIASLFGFTGTSQPARPAEPSPAATTRATSEDTSIPMTEPQAQQVTNQVAAIPMQSLQGTNSGYQIQVSGPGINTSLSITEEEDITIAIALLEKIRRQLKA